MDMFYVLLEAVTTDAFPLEKANCVCAAVVEEGKPLPRKRKRLYSPNTCAYSRQHTVGNSVRN